MTSHELATLSTALWVVGTVSVFILLAEWSSGGSWGLSSAIVHGVRGWSDRERLPGSVVSPYVEPLRPMLDPYSSLRRGAGPDARSGRPVPSRLADIAEVEIIELGERPIPRR